MEKRYDMLTDEERELAAALFTAYYDRMVTIADRYLHDDYIAAEIAANTMEKIVCHIGSFAAVPEEERIFLVAACTRNTALNYLRDNKKHASDLSLTLPKEEKYKNVSELDLPDESQNVMADAVCAEIRATVDRVFGELTEGQRKIAVLYFRQGKRPCEIAAALGVSNDSVRCKLYRIREQLRAALGEE